MSSAAAATGEEVSVEEDPEVAPLNEIRRLGTELILSARMGDVEQAKILLSGGAPVSFKDAGGWTALTWAASEGHIEVIDLLLEVKPASPEGEVKADEPEEEPTEPEMGNSALHWAAFKGHVHIVWRLLTNGHSPRTLDSEGNTALHLASTGNHLLIVQTLLSQGGDVAAKNAYGNAPLQLTTDAACQKLLRQAAVTAVEGRVHLCSCSGDFFTAADSVAANVTDRVSTPTVRPARYSHECAARIKAAEEALEAAIKAVDTEALEAAITLAEEAGAAVALLEDGIRALKRLRAQIELQAAVAHLDGQRPLKDRLLIRPLLPPLKSARANGVQPELIEAAEHLLQTVEAEAALLEQTDSCASTVMVAPEPEEGSEDPAASEFQRKAPAAPPPAASDFHRRAEAGLKRLGSVIAAAQVVEAMEEVVQTAEQLHRQLSAEMELRLALVEPEEEPGEGGGATVFAHPGGVKTSSLLEQLQLRNDMLDAALDRCAAEGSAEVILEEVRKTQKMLKDDLKGAVAEDEERKAREAAAAAKAAKKKKAPPKT